MSIEMETSKTLSVLRDTVAATKRPDSAMQVTSTGARLVTALRSFGFQGGIQRRMSTEEILQLSSVLICLDVRSQDIAKVPLRMYERMKNGGKRVVDPSEHPVALLLATRPNPYQTWNEFWIMMLLHFGVLENAYIAKRIEGGITIELIGCMPVRVFQLAVEPEDGSRGFFAYRVDRFSPQERIPLSGLPDIFLPNEFIHLKGRTFDGLQGYSNLDAGTKTFNMASSILDYSTRLFDNDGGMRGVFQKPGESGDALSDVAFKHLREQLAELLTNMRRHNVPIVLEEGMTFQEISMTADQAQSASAKDASIVDTARVFRIPPHKMMHLINVKYENMETLEKSYVSDSLIPTCVPIEQKLSGSLLSFKEQSQYFLQFDRREMLLNDQEKLAEVTKSMMAAGSMTFDEHRQALGWNPMEGQGGDCRTIPSTYNTVDSTGEVVIPAGAQPVADPNADPNADPAAADDTKPKPAKKPKKDVDDDVDNVVEFPSVVGER
jgi:HK97 family phage portal protein